MEASDEIMGQFQSCLEREGLPEGERAEIRDAIQQRAFSIVNADWLPTQCAPELTNGKFEGKASAKESKQSTPLPSLGFPDYLAVKEQKIANSPPFTEADLAHFQARKKMLEALNTQ